MRAFMIERDLPGIGSAGEAELAAAAGNSNAALAQLAPRVQWQHSYVTGDRTYCLYLAEDEDAIREHQLLMDSWRPPPNARSTDPQTSHDAAGQTEKKYARGIVLLRAYAEAGPLGLTTEEAGIVTGLADDQDSGYWKRRSDLSRQGYLMRTGQTRRSTQNREQQVYAITRDGLELLEALGV